VDYTSVGWVFDLRITSSVFHLTILETKNCWFWSFENYQNQRRFFGSSYFKTLQKSAVCMKEPCFDIFLFFENHSYI
jgi:hypothetical protein